MLSAHLRYLSFIVINTARFSTESIHCVVIWGVSFQATDGDTGAFGVDGIKYSVDSDALKIDSSGMLYLLKQQYAYRVTINFVCIPTTI